VLRHAGRVAVADVLAHLRRPLGEDLEDRLAVRVHDVEDLILEGVRNVVMEEVGHRVDEDLARPQPVAGGPGLEQPGHLGQR
jgi:hypothetical protein